MRLRVFSQDPGRIQRGLFFFFVPGCFCFSLFGLPSFVLLLFVEKKRKGRLDFLSRSQLVGSHVLRRSQVFQAPRCACVCACVCMFGEFHHNYSLTFLKTGFLFSYFFSFRNAARYLSETISWCQHRLQLAVAEV